LTYKLILKYAHCLVKHKMISLISNKYRRCNKLQQATHIGGFPTNNVWVHLNLKNVFKVFEALAGTSAHKV